MAKKSFIKSADDLLKVYRAKAPSRALVIGSKVYEGRVDRRGLYPVAVGVDLFEGDGVDLVHDMEQPLDAGMFDHVDCHSILEHARRPWLVAQNIEKILAPAGTLLISVPFIWRIHRYPADYWRITPDGLDVLFPSIEWKVKEFLCCDQVLKLPPAMTGRRGMKWMGRTEVIAFGVKCSSTS